MQRILTFTKFAGQSFIVSEKKRMSPCNLYELYEQNNLIGSLMVGVNESYWRTGDQLVLIEKVRSFLVEKEYRIIDTHTGNQIGFYFQADEPNRGNFLLEGNPGYHFENDPASIRDIFKWQTWRTYHFFMTGPEGAIRYQLNLGRWSIGSSVRPTGTVVLPSSVSVSVVLAGFFLMDKYFTANSD